MLEVGLVCAKERVKSLVLVQWRWHLLPSLSVRIDSVKFPQFVCTYKRMRSHKHVHQTAGNKISTCSFVLDREP